MSRDGLPRAYLRMSPDLDQHPDPLAMIRAICAAARQPDRGRFRDPRVLERAIGRRQYRFMVDRGDIIPAEPGPGIYLDGWDEWQEGDFTVAERMRRMRARRKLRTVSRVTVPASPRRNVVTTDAFTTDSSSSSAGVGVGEAPNPRRAGASNGSPRADRTNPRAVAEREATEKRQRRQQRELAYHRGELTEQQLADMNRDDVPLDAIARLAVSL